MPLSGDVWPACTEPGCDHVRTWTSPEYAAIARDIGGWLLMDWQEHPTGLSACRCHPAGTTATKARFPCDVWLREQAR